VDLAAEEDDHDYKTEHKARCCTLAASADPVHAVDLRIYFHNKWPPYQIPFVEKSEKTFNSLKKNRFWQPFPKMIALLIVKQ